MYTSDSLTSMVTQRKKVIGERPIWKHFLRHTQYMVLFKLKVYGQYHHEWESNRVSENSSIKLAQKDKYLKLQNEYNFTKRLKHSNQTIKLKLVC